jgi:glycosyltransferase involved in cell wall biosynthesis
VIHAHGLRAGAAAASAGIHPLVISWHNAALGRHLGLRAHAAAEAFQASRAEVILAVSPDLAERADRAGARRTELIEVPPGALPPPSHPPAVVLDRLQIDPRRPVVLAVARLEAQKRLDVLVAAAQAWQRPDAPVVLIAGSGRLRDALHRQIDRTKAPVRLLGPRDDVADLLSVASVLALPSRWEGWPATVVEAVRAQVPVVAADSPGVARLLGPQACLVPPGDAEALRSALEHVLDNPATARSLAGAATRRAAAWQTVEAAMDWTLDLYLDLVSSYRA